MSVPQGWRAKESKSHAGRLYYVNDSTGETTWDLPTTAAEAGSQVQCLHILKKHAGSSWRNPNITQGLDESITQITAFREALMAILQTQGVDAMKTQFMSTAAEVGSLPPLHIHHTHIHIHTHIHTYTYTHIHTYTHTHIHTYTHTHIHTYTHTPYIHTYIHTHTHTLHSLMYETPT
ncbi:hypothetical protein B484DRAFT_258542 [Ochromonadaceae sp. CCMP2298]|nr:hypothetical protein B484DRAFT_258542 [Ochromonadaceae sp. CCMP2298]